MKRERVFFKLGLGLLLIGLMLAFASCEKSEFIEKNEIYGTCKITWMGEGTALFRASDSLTIEGLDSAINNCNDLRGVFILNNDSNGSMCYTCQNNKWKPN